MVGDERHTAAQTGHEVLFQVDLWTVRILLHGCDHVVINTLLADDVVHQRFDGDKGIADIKLQRCPARYIPRHPRLRADRLDVRELQHAGGKTEPISRERLPARQRRSIDHRVMPQCMASLVKHDDAAGGLYGIEALPAEDRHVIGALPLFPRRVGGLIRLGKRERIDIPAHRGSRRRHLVLATAHDGAKGRQPPHAVAAALSERADYLRDERGVVANDERAAGKREGDPLLARPGCVFGSRQLVNGQRTATIDGDLRALLLDHPLVHFVNEAASLGIVAGDVHQHDCGQFACRRLDGADRILSTGDLQQIVECEAEPAEPTAVGAFELLANALDERLHGRVFEQEPILRAIETLAEFGSVGDAHPASGRGGKDLLTRWKSAVGGGYASGPDHAR